MDAIERLLQWAAAQGVIVNGIKPKLLPGRGIGLVATRAIEVRGGTKRRARVEEPALSAHSHLL